MFVMFLTFISVSFCFFFFKQKTAYEMRISDWSSDVCSSDLILYVRRHKRPRAGASFPWRSPDDRDLRLPVGSQAVLRREASAIHAHQVASAPKGLRGPRRPRLFEQGDSPRIGANTANGRWISHRSPSLA